MRFNYQQGTIRYREAGSGPTIVFVHGYLVDGRLWDGVVDGALRPLPLHRAGLADGRAHGRDEAGRRPHPARRRDDHRRLPRRARPRGRDPGRQRLRRRASARCSSPAGPAGSAASSSPTATPTRTSRPGIFKALPPLAKLPGGVTLLALPFRVPADRPDGVPARSRRRSRPPG